MKPLLIALMMAGMVGMAGMAGAGECPNAVRLAVMRQLIGWFPNYNESSVHLGGNYSKDYWLPLLDAEQKEINRVREWSRGIKDRCIRKEYGEWMDYYQYRLNGAYRELRTKEWQKSYEKGMKQLDKEQKESTIYEKEHNIPVPPR